MGKCGVPDKPPCWSLSCPEMRQLPILCSMLSCSVMSDSCNPVDRSLPGSSVHGIFYVCVYAFIQQIYIEHLLYMLVNGNWPIRPAPELPGTHSSERYRLVKGINMWSDKFSDAINSLMGIWTRESQHRLPGGIFLTSAWTSWTSQLTFLLLLSIILF